MTKYHAIYPAALRFQCVIIPAMPALSRRWSLPGEYTTVFAIAWSGFYLGTAVNFPLGSALCQSDWGWPGVFYVSGKGWPGVFYVSGKGWPGVF